MNKLNTPIDKNGLNLKNRVAMAPLTRCRAGENDVPQPMSELYYAQRASAGLIISEATNVTPKSCAFEKPPVFTVRHRFKHGKKSVTKPMRLEASCLSNCGIVDVWAQMQS